MKSRLLQRLMFNYLFLFLLSGNLFAQEFLFHFNNTVDEKSKKPELVTQLTTVWNGLQSIIRDKSNFKSDNISIDVVMLDPTKTGSLIFKSIPHNVKDILVEKWKQQYANEYRVLFYFIKEKEYVCNKFCVTEKLKNDQILNQVEKYIDEQIVLQKKDNAKDAIYGGINALKNAFNLDFNQDLIAKAPPLLKQSCFYPDYAFIQLAYYYFISDIDPKYKDKAIRYNENGLENMLSVLANPLFISDLEYAKVRDVYSDNKLYYKVNKENKYINNSDKNIFIEDLYTTKSITSFNDLSNYIDLTNTKVMVNGKLVNFNTIEEYNGNNYFAKTSHLKFLFPILKKLNDTENYFKEWNYINANGVTFYDASKYSFCKVYAHSGVALKGDNIGVLNVKSIYHSGNPTWCNQFAIELSKSIYGKDSQTGDYPAPSGNGNYSANDQYDYFSSHSVYVKLEKGKKDVIWSYVNKGYPVYFSWKNPTGRSGHIETGYPSNGSNLGNNMGVGFDQSLSNYGSGKYNDGTNDFCCVGAGGVVGFKNFDSYFFLNNWADAFLYLGYLTKEY